MSSVLPQSFYARECLAVAVDLLGKELVQGEVVLRITEVEAYRFPGDTANHCRFGRTARNAPMWGPPGHAYVYLCYGMHALLNLVTDNDGEGAAVLVRAAEVVAGHALVAQRRGGLSGPQALAGPAKVTRGLGIDTRWTGRSLIDGSGLHVREAAQGMKGAARRTNAALAFRVGPRVGVDYADPVHRDAPWRLAVCESAAVSVPRTLTPWLHGAQRFLHSQPMPTQDVPPALSARRRLPSRS